MFFGLFPQKLKHNVLEAAFAWENLLPVSGNATGSEPINIIMILVQTRPPVTEQMGRNLTRTE